MTNIFSFIKTKYIAHQEKQIIKKNSGVVKETMLEPVQLPSQNQNPIGQEPKHLQGD